jgi:glycosyltransferase involved in cell wall biosynthesis
LVSVKPTCLSYLYCLPNKLFEYILAGVPVLSNELPDCRALIEDLGVGEVVQDDTPEGWRSALLQMQRRGTQPFQEGLQAAPHRISWKQEKAHLEAIYANIAH